MIKEKDLITLDIDFAAKKSCSLRILSLFWLPCLLYLAVIAGYINLIPLKIEIHSVILIGIIFVIYLFFMKHNAFYSSCLFRSNFAQMENELKEYINNNLLTIGDTTKANASFESFLRRFSSSLRNENFSSVAAGIFPTLGILGTFISIAVTMPDFSSRTSAVLEKEISLLLGGVGTAFYVSIYGIFLSLWWIFYEKGGMSLFEKDARGVKARVRHLFWNKEEIEQTYFRKSMENYEKLNTVFDSLSSNELIENMNKTLSQRLELFDNIISLEKDVAEKASEHLQDMTQEAEKSLQIREKLLDSYENILKAINSFTEETRINKEHMLAVNTKFSQSENSISQLTQQLSKNIGQLNGLLSNIGPENVKKLFQGVVKNLETMKGDTDRIGWSLNTHLNDFDEKIVEKLKKSLEMIDRETSQIIRQLMELKNTDEQ